MICPTTNLLVRTWRERRASKTGGRTPREERIIAGFEDIQRFLRGAWTRAQHGEELDIFERLYAVRLDRLREQPECRDLLALYDKYNLLNVSMTADGSGPESLDDDSLLAELGIAAASDDDITVLKHVTSREEKRAAEEIANRTPCEDFDRFKPLFSQVKQELDLGMRETREFQRTAEIKQGEFFIVGGQIAYVAELGDEFVTEYERKDRRLRVIYDNGTESNVLARSLQKALYRDGAGRRITNPAAGPLFDDTADNDDLASGTIYVLRSKSEHPTVAAHRDLIHKIGVTGGRVEARITNAETDATYLLAGVEVVATYNLFNIKRSKLENILHRVFARARLDLTIEDRFGNPVKPKEWFLVPLQVIDEVVDRIRDQSIVGYEYNPSTASLRPS